MNEWFPPTMRNNIKKYFTTDGKDGLARNLGFSFFKSKNVTFQDANLQTCRLAQLSHHTAVPFSAQGINFLNQLLEEMND